MSERLDKLIARLRDDQTVTVYAEELREYAAEVARLRQALTRYGAHEPGCAWSGAASDDGTCTCGFIAALAGGDATP